MIPPWLQEIEERILGENKALAIFHYDHDCSRLLELAKRAIKMAEHARDRWNDPQYYSTINQEAREFLEWLKEQK